MLKLNPVFRSVAPETPISSGKVACIWYEKIQGKRFTKLIGNATYAGFFVGEHNIQSIHVCTEAVTFYSDNFPIHICLRLEQ